MLVLIEALAVLGGPGHFRRSGWWQGRFRVVAREVEGRLPGMS